MNCLWFGFRLDAGEDAAEGADRVMEIPDGNREKIDGACRQVSGSVLPVDAGLSSVVRQHRPFVIPLETQRSVFARLMPLSKSKQPGVPLESMMASGMFDAAGHCESASTSARQTVIRTALPVNPIAGRQGFRGRWEVSVIRRPTSCPYAAACATGPAPVRCRPKSHRRWHRAPQSACHSSP